MSPRHSASILSSVKSPWGTLYLNRKGYIVRATELNNENIYVLQIGASLCFKLGQVLHIKAIITNLGIKTITVGRINEVASNINNSDFKYKEY